MSCASTHRSWSGVEAEEVEWRQRKRSGGRGSWRWLEAGGGGEGRAYHDTGSKQKKPKASEVGSDGQMEEPEGSPINLGLEMNLKFDHAGSRIQGSLGS